MIEEGALGKYPVEAVYGMQNWPELGFGPIRHPARADDGRFRAIRRIAGGACRTCVAEMEMRYERRYPPTVNAAPETEIAATTAASLVGESDVRRDLLPSQIYAPGFLSRKQAKSSVPI